VKGLVPTVPGRHHDFTLIVRVDQADQIAQNDAMPVAEAGARQDHRRQTGVTQVNRDAGRNQVRLTGCDDQRLVDARAQVEAGRSGVA
jgi:hypothetical protein